MKPDELLSGLEKLVADLGVKLRYEKGDFSGGYCVLKDDPMIIIQKRLDDDLKIRILARELAQADLEHLYIVPALREIIEAAAEELRKPPVTLQVEEIEHEDEA